MATARVVVDTHLAGVQALAQRLSAAAHSRVKVGVPAGPTEENGTSTALVGAVHEFGSPARGIPERSWLRTGIRESAGELGTFSRHAVQQIVRELSTVPRELGRIGAFAVGKVQAKLVAGPFEPNAPETIARKGSDRPLIDTGHLRQSVAYEVETA